MHLEPVSYDNVLTIYESLIRYMVLIRFNAILQQPWHTMHLTVGQRCKKIIGGGSLIWRVHIHYKSCGPNTIECHQEGTASFLDLQLSLLGNYHYLVMSL